MNNRPTPEQVVKMMERMQSYDLTGGFRTTLVATLPFALAQAYLKPEATPELWGEPLTAEHMEHKAQVMLNEWRWAITNGHFGRSFRICQSYVGIKFFLGHKDWRDMPGGPDNETAIGFGGQGAFAYIEEQLSTRKWEQLSKEGSNERAIDA